MTPDGIIQAGFLAQAEHHPLGDTLKPANKEQAPVPAVKNWQFEHALPGLQLGFLAVLASSTYPSAWACGLSRGSFVRPAACAFPIKRMAIGKAAVAIAATMRKRRREGTGEVMSMVSSREVMD